MFPGTLFIFTVVIVISFEFSRIFWRPDYGFPQVKPVYKKENGTPAYGGPAPYGGSTSYASSVMENNVNRQLPSYRYLSFPSYIYKNVGA